MTTRIPTAAAILALLAACGAQDDNAAAAQDATAAVGRRAPDFTLTDTGGAEHTLGDYLAQGKTVVLEWFNPDCPYVRARHDPSDGNYRAGASMAAAAEAVTAGGDVVWLAINSNTEGSQGSGLERNREAVQDYGIDYPVLLDPSGEVGKAYDAETTPHMFVIAADGMVIYEGAIDDGSREPGDLNYVVECIESHAAGEPVATSEVPPFGCSVKYGS